MLRTSGDGPEAMPAGNRKLICMRPAMNPGAPPAYITCAVFPPTVAETGSSGLGKLAAAPFANLPSAPAGLVCPTPRAQRTTTLSPYTTLFRAGRLHLAQREAHR